MNAMPLRELKHRVGIARVLEAYHLDRHLRRHGDQLLGPCPLHGGDNPTAFRVHLGRGLWHCFTACGGGDAVDLIRRIEACSIAAAARILQGWLETPTRALDLPSRRHSPPRPNAFRPFRRSIALNPRVPFLQHHKAIRVETALRFEAGLADPISTFLRGTVAVRLHDLDGQPIGYCGRRVDAAQIQRWGKWRFPARFPKSQVLYNAHRALAQRPGGIVLVECPWAVMRLTQAGVPGVVALLGTTLGPIQSAWLAAAPTVLLLLDGDPAGYAATAKISQILSKSTKVATHRLAPGQEPEDLSDLELANLVRRALPFL